MAGSPDQFAYGTIDLPGYRRDVIAPLYSHDVLDGEQEIKLAGAIKTANNVRKQILDGSICPSMETDAIIGEGKNAIDTFVISNIRWLDQIARRYQGRCGSLRLEDLIQEGSFGLIRATKTFDPEQGNRFLTYATPWIHQAIRRAIVAQGSMIRHPEYLVIEIGRIKRMQQKLSHEFDRSPTAEEIAARLGIDKNRVLELIDYDRMGETISLDLGVGENKDSSLAEFIPDNSQELSDQIAAADSQRELYALLSSLGDRERRIIELRSGLYDGAVWTLQEVADVFGITRQRVDQLEKVALGKLRTLAKKGYLE